MSDDQTPGPLTPLGTPGPLTQAAIEKAKTLPENQLAIDAATSDFKTVDLTVGVKRKWSNGWGAGAWIGAKLGSSKPIGSAGVTVTKTLGLLGEVDDMNWLQRNLPSRDSWAWIGVMAASILAFLTAHYKTLQAAFELAPQWEQRIELLAGLAAVLAAKQSMSWVPTKDRQEQAIVTKQIKETFDELETKPPAPGGS